MNVYDRPAINYFAQNQTPAKNHENTFTVKVFAGIALNRQVYYVVIYAHGGSIRGSCSCFDTIYNIYTETVIKQNSIGTAYYKFNYKTISESSSR